MSNFCITCDLFSVDDTGSILIAESSSLSADCSPCASSSLTITNLNLLRLRILDLILHIELCILYCLLNTKIYYYIPREVVGIIMLKSVQITVQDKHAAASER